MKLTNDIVYVGVNDRKIDLFEGQFIVPEGISYNSYVILDEKIAVMDGVGEDFADEWLDNIRRAAGGRDPDYLVVQHMEPDHSRNIHKFAEAFPNSKIVASEKAWGMMKAFNGFCDPQRSITVGEGDRLELGAHTLSFIAAAMIHWPEVIMSYDSKDKVLFSADAFGKFGALDYDDPEGWSCEARRYYFGIVGKYGAQVQGLLKKAAALDIQKIFPLHGPMLTENLSDYIRLYDIWSSYGVESEGVAIFYTSIYGNTKEAALLLAEKLKEFGCPKVALSDLAREDWAEAVEDAFRYGKIVLAASTYNNGIFPAMRDFINNLIDRNFQNRTIALMENGSWAPAAAKKMREMLCSCKNLNVLDGCVSIKSAMTPENEKQIEELRAENEILKNKK